MDSIYKYHQRSLNRHGTSNPWDPNTDLFGQLRKTEIFLGFCMQSLEGLRPKKMDNMGSFLDILSISPS